MITVSRTLLIGALLLTGQSFAVASTKLNCISPNYDRTDANINVELTSVTASFDESGNIVNLRPQRKYGTVTVQGSKDYALNVSKQSAIYQAYDEDDTSFGYTFANQDGTKMELVISPDKSAKILREGWFYVSLKCNFQK
jgi:hypothetical protein